MTLFSATRMAAAIRQYGQIAEIDTEPPVAITLLVSQIAPLRHPDLPSEGMRGEALALVPAGMPQDGQTLRSDGVVWQIESAVPLDRQADTGSEGAESQPVQRLYQLQLVRLHGGAVAPPAGQPERSDS